MVRKGVQVAAAANVLAWGENGGFRSGSSQRADLWRGRRCRSGCSQYADLCRRHLAPASPACAVKAGKIPKLPAAERLLPRGTAATKLREQGHDQAASLAVYDYWLLRRRQAKGPLLGHLWFEQPWKVRRSWQGGWQLCG